MILENLNFNILWPLNSEHQLLCKYILDFVSRSIDLGFWIFLHLIPLIYKFSYVVTLRFNTTFIENARFWLVSSLSGNFVTCKNVMLGQNTVQQYLCFQTLTYHIWYAFGKSINRSFYIARDPKHCILSFDILKSH